MDCAVYVDHYLAVRREQRNDVFQTAASSSILMRGVILLSVCFYHLFDAYSRSFLLLRLRLKPPATREEIAEVLKRLYADAIDTYHLLWVFVTFACYAFGWWLNYGEGEVWSDYLLWVLPLAPCIYRLFEIFAALIEMYFRESNSPHHQFRILLHAFLYYLGTGFAFALIFLFADWQFSSFTIRRESQFDEFFEPIYHSLMTIGWFGGKDEPQDWIGKLLMLLEFMIGFILATFIFLNITQIWMPGEKTTKM